MEYINLFFYRIHAFWNNPELLSSFVNNRFLLIFLVVFLMRIKSKTYKSLWACSMVNIPGTILHETMHYIVGLVMNAKPCNFTVFPKKEGDYYVMGSVSFKNITFYNAIPASMAPLFLLVIGYYINKIYLPQMLNPTLFKYIAYVFLQTIIIENAIPSSADFRVAKKYFSGILLYGCLFFIFVLFA